jgi:chromosome partitioning protein
MAKASDLILMPTGYGLDDLEAQVEAAYELEESGIDRDRIWFVFCRTTGSPAEDQAARDYLVRSKIKVFEPIFPELPSIRQGHNAGKAASEISFPAVQERAIALAVAIAERIQDRKEAA